MKNKITALQAMQNVAEITETMAGLRNALISQGFSQAAAEQLVIEFVRRQPR